MLSPEQVAAIRKYHKDYDTTSWMPEDGYTLPGGKGYSAFGVIDDFLDTYDTIIRRLKRLPSIDLSTGEYVDIQDVLGVFKP